MKSKTKYKRENGCKKKEAVFLTASFFLPDILETCSFKPISFHFSNLIKSDLKVRNSGIIQEK
jgi:hypothetical protein